MNVVYFCLVSDIFTACIPVSMSSTCKTDEHFLEKRNKVEELTLICYDIYYSDPRISQKNFLVITVSLNGDGGFRNGVSPVLMKSCLSSYDPIIIKMKLLDLTL